MKRLTKRLEDGQAVMDCDACARYGSTCTVLACRNRLKDRICDYEDVMQSNGLIEQKNGRWEMLGDNYANCTNCGNIFETLPTPMFFKANNKYCRKCGAKMDGGSHEVD